MKQLIWLLVLSTSCAYFNTFYNARQFHKQAMTAKDKEKDKIQASTLELFDKSIEKSAIIIKEHPRSRWVDDALFLMGKCYYEKREYVRARDKLDALDLFYPNSPLRPRAAYYRGLCYLEEKNYGLAIVAFSELAEKNAKYQELCRYRLGEIYFLQADYVKSLDFYKDFLGQFPKTRHRAAVWGYMGDAANNLKKHGLALEHYGRALKVAKSKDLRDSFKLKMGRSYLLLQDYTGGLTYLRGETDPEFLLLKTRIFKAAGLKTEQLKLLHELTRDQLGNETAAEVFYEIGRVYQADETYDTALIYFDSAYARAATSPCGENSIKCKQTINKILEYRAKSQDDPARAQFLLAELYFVNLSDTARALVEYEKVYQGFADSPFAPKAMYAYAWITENMLHQDSLARVAYRQLIEKYPDTEYSQAARQRIGE